MFIGQSIQRPIGANVFGSCLIRVEPDYASLWFTVTRLADTPAKAFGDGRGAAGSVREFLAKSGIAEADVRASEVTLEQEFSGAYGQERRFLGYRTHVRFNVLLREFARYEEVLVGVVDAGANIIDKVSFKTSRLKELRAEARKGAVAAARVKAGTYCAAAGVKLGSVVHIEDVNPDEMSRRSHMPDVDLAEHDESDSAAEPSPFRPGSIVVAAAVMVCFSILP